MNTLPRMRGGHPLKVIATWRDASHSRHLREPAVIGLVLAACAQHIPSHARGSTPICQITIGGTVTTPACAAIDHDNAAPTRTCHQARMRRMAHSRAKPDDPTEIHPADAGVDPPGAKATPCSHTRSAHADVDHSATCRQTRAPDTPARAGVHLRHASDLANSSDLSPHARG